MSDIKIPNKFVGLHAHSVLSVGDGIGYPQEHIDFALKNGMDAHALTDHGNVSGFGFQQNKLKDLKKAGIKFKGIVGEEFYYIDSLAEWKKLYEPKQEPAMPGVLVLSSGDNKHKTLEEEHLEELNKTVGNEAIAEDDDVKGTVIELEAESKSFKWLDPKRQRNHLVVLAKNKAGLKSLFSMCSESYLNSSHGFPRIDLDMIRKYSNGNLIGLSACMAGALSYAISKEYLDVMDAPLDVWLKDEERFKRTQKILDDKVELFAEAFGGYENYYPEIQFNRIPHQHLLNWHILNLAKRKGIKIVATADSHYSNPDHWRDREIYKAMAWASKTKGTVDPNTLPQKIADLKCELYPKNASQMWECYKKYASDGAEKFYEGFDGAVSDAIELTHDIAHNHVSDDVVLDSKVKLPSIHKLMNKDLYDEFKVKVTNPEDENEITQKYLTKLCVDGLKEKKKTTPEYIERLKYELDVVRHLGLSKYFITYWKAITKAEEELFCGAGRGSGAGSLICYLLGITKPDPIKYGLLFSRFLSYKKAGAADIDCLLHSTLIKTPIGNRKISDLCVGDFVLGFNNKPQRVINVQTREINENDKILEFMVFVAGELGSFICTDKHRLFRGNKQEVFAKDLKKGDVIFSDSGECLVRHINEMDIVGEQITDISVEGDKSFNVVLYGTEKELLITSHNSDTSDRSRMIELLIELFGEDSVSPISTYGQLQLKSLIKDLGRLYALDFEDLNKRTALIEKESLAGARKNTPGFDRGVWVLTYEEALKYSPTFNQLIADFPQVDQHLKVLFKQIKSVGRHAGGVILSDKIQENMPLIKSGGEIQTPWTDGVNFRHLEGFGFLKFDFLGVGTLRMLQEATKRVMIKEGNPNPSFKEIKEWYNSRLAPDNCEYDDQKVYEHVFWNKNYAATFQYVSSDVQEFSSKFKPTCLEDLSIITSVFRPGPMSANVHHELLEAKLHPEQQKLKHPLLKEVLGNTYGKIVYQEQLQLIYHKLGGVPLDETDYVRKAFTKKEISGTDKANAEKQRLKQEFIGLCKTNNDISETVSTSVFADIEKMAAYSFNKSHSLSYMITAYATAWFLTYHPDEWLAVYIDHCSGDKGTAVGKEDPKAVAIKESKTLGYEIVYPDVNKTFYHCWAGSKKIYPGFRSVKYVSEAGTSEVIKGRPFTSITQFLTDPETGLWKFTKVANKRTIETLIKIEAFPELVGPDKEFKNHKHLCNVVIGNFDKLKKAAAKKKLQETINQFNMICPDLSDWTKQEKEDFKLKLAGINSFEIPEAFLLKAKELNIPSIEEFEDKGMYWGITEECTVATTKTGKLYLKLKIKGLNNRIKTVMLWSFDPIKGPAPIKNNIVVGTFEDSDFGLKGFANTLKIFKA